MFVYLQGGLFVILNYSQPVDQKKNDWFLLLYQYLLKSEGGSLSLQAAPIPIFYFHRES